MLPRSFNEERVVFSTNGSGITGFVVVVVVVVVVESLSRIQLFL